MPLDASGFDETELFRTRRLEAGKLWSEIPFLQFDIRGWHRRSNQFCALSWLAQSEHDNWRWTMTREDSVPGWGRRKEFPAAAKYFGLTLAQAEELFVGDRACRRFYGVPFAWMITGKMVANKLMKLPYQRLPYETWEKTERWQVYGVEPNDIFTLA